MACVLLAFAAMGGARGMDTHPLASHGTHFGHIIAKAETTVSHAPADPHAGHHMEPSAGPTEAPTEQEAPAGECTCVGPCQGGTAPNVTRGVEYTVATGDVRTAPQVAESIRLVDRDPTSHLLPLPNGPPARV